MASVFTIPSTTFQSPSTTSATFTIPANANTVTAAFTVGATDVADPTQSFAFELDRFDAGTSTWLFDNGFTWQGGVVNSKTGQFGQPAITVGVGPLHGQQCRVVITNSKAITMSAVITTT